MAQVAWPGVQPSPLGGGEAPTAQESQPKVDPEPEASPEVKATPKETPKDTHAATPAEYTDYVTDMAAVQST